MMTSSKLRDVSVTVVGLSTRCKLYSIYSCAKGVQHISSCVF